MDVLDYLKFLASLVFVLALIGALAYVVRRHGLGGMVPPMRARNRRLVLVETLSIDPRNRLILVRRDHVEYIVLVGSTNLVIDQISVPSNTDKRAHTITDHIRMYDSSQSSQGQPDSKILRSVASGQESST